MISVRRMDHLNMGVRSIAETTQFYQDLFGFEEKESGVGIDGAPFAIIGAADRVYLCIYEYSDLSINEENLYVHHFGFHLDDFDLALKELRDRKIELNYGTWRSCAYPRRKSCSTIVGKCSRNSRRSVPRRGHN